MAVTATLVFVGHNRLRYRLNQDGAAGTTLNITSTGAASPDLITDSVAGPIKNLANVVANGYAQLAAGVQTQAKARALWLSDWSGSTPGNINTVTARCDLEQRGDTDFSVDANVDGGGNPVLAITAGAAAGVCMLDVCIPNTIGA